MQNRAARADFFDASALVKVFTNEPGSEIVRPYFDSRATKQTTPFCFYEALSALKSKWLHKKQLTKDEYLDAAFKLTIWYSSSYGRASDLDFTDHKHFKAAKKIVEIHGIDLSDAFQIISVKYGYFSVLANDSSTVLVTGDKALAIASREEGLRTWYFLDDPAP